MLTTTTAPTTLQQFTATGSLPERFKRRGYFVRDGHLCWQGIYAGMHRTWELTKPNSAVQVRLLQQFVQMVLEHEDGI